jgi:hypothetical protein
MPSSTIKLAQLRTDEGVSPRDVALQFVLKHCPLPPAVTFEGACVALLLGAAVMLGLCHVEFVSAIGDGGSLLMLVLRRWLVLVQDGAVLPATRH